MAAMTQPGSDPTSDPTAPPAPVGPRRQARALGGTVGSGLSWLMVATLAVKAFSVVNIAVLGVLLSKEDFGIFATAIGVAALVNVLRDGGVRRILVQKGSSRYAGLIGPVYAMTVLLNLLAAVALIALGPAMAWFHHDQRFVAVMGTLGLAAAFYGPGMIYRAKLSMDFRYKAVAGLNAAAALVHYASMIALAYFGAGPLTFTVSLVIVALFEWGLGMVLTRDPLLRIRLRLRLWPALWARAKWLILSALALALLRQGDYLVLGFLLDPRIIGIYAFAYMIAAQVLGLVAGNLQQVLMPAMSAFQHDRTRHARAALRVSGAIVLVASGLAGGIAVVIDPLQQLIWGGKWTAAVPAAQALALCFGFRLLVTVQESALSSTGRFREQFVAIFLQGIGMVVVAGVAGALFPREPGLIAFAIGLYIAIGVSAVAGWGLSRVGVQPVAFFGAIVRPWGVLTVLALALITADMAIQARGLEAWTNHPLLRIAALGPIYAIIALVSVRLLLAPLLRDIVTIVPARLRGPASRVMLLGKAQNSVANASASSTLP